MRARKRVILPDVIDDIRPLVTEGVLTYLFLMKYKHARVTLLLQMLCVLEINLRDKA